MAVVPLSNTREFGIKPYINSKARLSQIWINRWTVLVLLVLVRCFFASASVLSNLKRARAEALKACTEVESVGSSMASMPHYMAAGVNDMTAVGVEKAVDGLVTVLDLAISGVEEIIIFFIHMMKSTYLCLITLAVRGSLKAVANFGSAASEDMQKTVNELTDGLGDTSKALSDSLSDIKSKIEHIPGLQKLKLPTVDFSDQIEKLKSMDIPRDLLEEFNGMNNSIPTFDEVQDFVDNTVRFPFEQVKKKIHDMGAFHFDRALLPVPQKEQLDFCTKGSSISDFFEQLLRKILTMRNTVLIVLVVLAVLVCIPLAAWVEVRRNSKIDEAKAALEKTGLTFEHKDPILQSHPSHLSSWGMWLSQRSEPNSGQNAIRWLFAYATSPPMMFVLTLGTAGMLSCAFQYMLLRSINAAAPKLTSQVADFGGDIMKSLHNSSTSWSTGANEAIQKLDKQFNEEVFGFVNITTSAVNDTLNAFVEKTSTTLDNAFGGTVLHDPVKEVIHCLIGLKIASFQKGLTWVHEHAHVSFPALGNDVFALGPLSELSNAHSAAELLANTNEKGTDEVTGALKRVADRLLYSLRYEAVISGVVICCWLLIVTGGAIYVGIYIATNSKDFPFQPKISAPRNDSPQSQSIGKLDKLEVI
jgi:hypothetical protein